MELSISKDAANEFLKIHIDFILHSVHFRNSQSSHFKKWQNIKKSEKTFPVILNLNGVYKLYYYTKCILYYIVDSICYIVYRIYCI